MNKFFLIALLSLATASGLNAALAPVNSSAPGTVSSVTYTPSPADMNDLDHHSVYTWRIDNITVNPADITSATLTFNNIANWDTNPNVLHLHLLDTAKNAGVASFVDDSTNSSPVTDMTDDFTSARYHNNPTWLVAAGTADTFLANASFTTTPTTYSYTFTGTALTVFEQYISNGHDLAIGMDPDCHFYNDGISLTIDSVTPVPEMATMIPVSCLLALAIGSELRRRRMAR